MCTTTACWDFEPQALPGSSPNTHLFQTMFFILLKMTKAAQNCFKKKKSGIKVVAQGE